MFEKVPHGCKKTRRVILQQTKAHHFMWILSQLHFQFSFQMNLKNFDRTVKMF